MFRKLILPISLILFNVKSCFAEVTIHQDCHSLKELIPFIQERSLIFLDIDLSVLVENPLEQCVEKVEKDVLETLEVLRSKGAIIFALTSRSFQFADRTIQQLADIGIHYGIFLDKLSLRTETFSKDKSHQGYKDGIIFTGAENKGKVLKSFLSLHPELIYTQISLMDDDEKEIADIKESLADDPNPIDLFHFKGAEQRHNEILKDLALVQKVMLEHKVSNLVLQKRARKLGLSFKDYLKKLSKKHINKKRDQK